MIDNLTEAIAHAKEVASKVRKNGNYLYFRGNSRMANECEECAKEHEQLAEWLAELKARREADRWISVDEALPEKEGWYLVDRKERTSSIQYFFFSTVNHKPYWSGECKVYYWRPLPEPYKESEAENGNC